MGWLYLITPSVADLPNDVLKIRLEAVLKSNRGELAAVHFRQRLSIAPSNDEFRACSSLVQRCHDAGVKSVLHGTLEDAQVLGCDGLRVPKDASSRIERVKEAGLHWVYSAHGVEEAGKAIALQPAYVLLAPIAAPFSKPDDPRQPLGMSSLAQFDERQRQRIVALGGMTPPLAAQCMAQGVAGVAVLTQVLGQEDAAGMFRAFCRQR